MINLSAQLLAFAITAVVAVNAEGNVISEGRLKHLLDELTSSSERQQRALDEIALSDQRILKMLPKYFFDKRKIASSDVKFLNSSANIHEEYFSTRGSTVDEVVIQFYCWRSEQCFPSDDPKNLAHIRRKFGVKHRE